MITIAHVHASSFCKRRRRALSTSAGQSKTPGLGCSVCGAAVVFLVPRFVLGLPCRTYAPALAQMNRPD